MSRIHTLIKADHRCTSVLWCNDAVQRAYVAHFTATDYEEISLLNIPETWYGNRYDNCGARRTILRRLPMDFVQRTAYYSTPMADGWDGIGRVSVRGQLLV